MFAVATGKVNFTTIHVTVVVVEIIYKYIINLIRELVKNIYEIYYWYVAVVMVRFTRLKSQDRTASCGEQQRGCEKIF